MYYLAVRNASQRDQTFLEILPTLRPGELELLAERNSALWSRYLKFSKR